MLDSLWITLSVAVVLGFLAGLGIGGGSLLILWLTMVLGMEQEVARGINLLFFLPAAVISSLFHRKQGRIRLQVSLPAVISGCIAAGLFSWFSIYLNIDLLKKLFGVLLLATGIRELTHKAG